MGTFRSAAAGASSRREFLVGAAKGGALLAATGGLTSLVDACGNSPSTTATVGTVKKSVKGEQVRLLTWELYADPSFTKAFERKYAPVSPTYFGSFDEMFGKLRAGGGSSYDAVMTASDVAIPLAQVGELAPIDTSAMVNYNNIRPQLRHSDLWNYKGKQYAVPLDWGSTVILADTARLGPLPDTLPFSMLLDKEFRRAVGVMDDLSVIYTAAIYLGYPTFWNLSNTQLADVQKFLVSKLLPNVVKFAVTFADEADLFGTKEIAIAWGWTGVILSELLLDHIDYVTEHVITPAMPWYVDTISAVADSPNLAAVQDWINYNLLPQVAARRFDLMALPSVVPAAAKYLTPAEQKQSYLTLAQASFWKDLDPNLQWHPVPRRALYQQVWNSVKAGISQFSAA